jgi:hypothetical protein
MGCHYMSYCHENDNKWLDGRMFMWGMEIADGGVLKESERVNFVEAHYMYAWK